MKKLPLTALLCTFAICGCASNKKNEAKTKPIFERPWVGGQFEQVRSPASVHTNSSRFGKRGALITQLHKETPLEKAGLQEMDLVLAINGSKVRDSKQIQKAIDKNGTAPSTFTIYRNGEIIDKPVTPGTERFQRINSIALAFGFHTRFEVDIFPDPDFSLIALGYEEHHDRLDLNDPKSKYRQQLSTFEGKPTAQEGWQGLSSEEGWRFWLGPFWLTQHKTILSQK